MFRLNIICEGKSESGGQPKVWETLYYTLYTLLKLFLTLSTQYDGVFEGYVFGNFQIRRRPCDTSIQRPMSLYNFGRKVFVYLGSCLQGGLKRSKSQFYTFTIIDVTFWVEIFTIHS